MDFKLSTDYNIEQCKEKLTNNVDRSLISGELKINFIGKNSLRVRRRVNNAFTSCFYGKFSTEDKKTVLQGQFKVSKAPFVFHGLIITVFTILLFYGLVMLLINHNIKSIANIILAIGVILFEVFFIKITKKKGQKDQIYIIDKLQNVLNGKQA